MMGRELRVVKPARSAADDFVWEKRFMWVTGPDEGVPMLAWEQALDGLNAALDELLRLGAAVAVKHGKRATMERYRAGLKRDRGRPRRSVNGTA